MMRFGSPNCSSFSIASGSAASLEAVEKAISQGCFTYDQKIPRGILANSATGTIKFIDIDLIDTHTAAKSFVSAVWTKAGGATASVSDPGGLSLSAVHEDPTDTDNQGSVDWTYSATDANLDFLAAGETLVVTYNVKITDNTGSFVTQPVTVTITAISVSAAMQCRAAGRSISASDAPTHVTRKKDRKSVV